MVSQQNDGITSLCCCDCFSQGIILNTVYFGNQLSVQIRLVVLEALGLEVLQVSQITQILDLLFAQAQVNSNLNVGVSS